METNVLIKESEKYGGQYVATRSFVDKDVVSHGNDPVKVFNEAKDKGVKEPVVFYVPKKDVVQIYKNALR
ncbi:MAG: hypothetical protein SCARUB_01669 [Candidatus Scalindua rubra]|uniref:DUF5678 domain-containing protein n=1 Tax=Candidatus Scalindua rubra TaxID=1872076 RepID=A0A1E3XC20_9BACT|nr:MAG: hypothetical protein SCARUB_01669 [Candidatus Scalindua rubra]